MEIREEEKEQFFVDYYEIAQHMRNTLGPTPSPLEVLAGVLVMRNEDPIRLVELMKEMKDNK